MSSSTFEPNPNFWPDLEREVTASVNETLNNAANKVRGNARDVVASATEVIPATPDLDGVGGAIHLTTMLGRVFEKGTSERVTRSGASRGRITAEPTIEPALKSEAAHGLYLNL